MDVVGAQFLVITVQDNGPFHPAVAVGVAYKNRGADKTRVDFLRHVNGGYLLKVGPPVYPQFRGIVVVGNRIGRHNLHNAVTVNIPDKRHIIAMDVVRGVQHLRVPRLLLHVAGTVRIHHVVGQHSLRCCVTI